MLELSDIVEIQQVLNHVHHIIDERDWKSFDQVFAQDAVYDLSYRNLPPVEGVAGIAELCAASYKRDYSDLMGHHAMNIYVYEDESGAVRAKSKVICVMADGKSTCAQFEDLIVKTASGWRIKRRTASTRHRDAASWTKAAE